MFVPLTKTKTIRGTKMKTTTILAAAVISIGLFYAASTNSQSLINVNYDCDYPGCPDQEKPELTVKFQDYADRADVSSQKKSVEVKNIWKEMPTFDKFGNEITGRARKNMRENALLEKMRRERSTETSGQKEVQK